MKRNQIRGIESDAAEPLRSPRKSIHYADKKMIGETPMMVLIQGKKTDYDAGRSCRHPLRKGSR